MNNLPFRPAPNPDDLLSDWHKYVAVKTVAAIRGHTVDSVAAQMFGKSRGAEVIKAAVDPASMTGWGSQLGRNLVGSFLRSLRPRSAAAILLDRVPRYDLGSGTSTITLPRLSADMPATTWVNEAGAIPVLRANFDTSLLGPAKKMAALSAVTHELATLSAEDAVAMVTELLEDGAAKQLDVSMFSAAAATAIQPAGLLNAVTALTPTAGGGQAAMLADLRAIAGGMASAGLGNNFLLFCNNVQAMTVGVLTDGPQEFEVISSPSLPAGTVVAVHPGGLAAGFGAEPDIDISENALIHFEDTNPLQISTAGSPNTVAAPVRSAFQTATHVLRLILDVAFVTRKNGAVQHLSSVTW